MADEESTVVRPGLQLSPMAIASISCAAGAILFGFIGAVSGSDGMFGLTGLLFIAAIVTGIITLAQRRPGATAQERSTDQVVAAAGITIGTIGITMMIVIVILAILFVMFMVWLFVSIFAGWSGFWW